MLHVPKKSLWSRIFIPDRPPARKYRGITEGCYSHRLTGAGQVGVKIICLRKRHAPAPTFLFDYEHSVLGYSTRTEAQAARQRKGSDLCCSP